MTRYTIQVIAYLLTITGSLNSYSQLTVASKLNRNGCQGTVSFTAGGMLPSLT